MNNLFAFKALLLEMGYEEVPYNEKVFNVEDMKFMVDMTSGTKRKNKDNGEVFEYAYVVQLGSGVGYAGFCCWFFFDVAGKFITHGCWE